MKWNKRIQIPNEEITVKIYDLKKFSEAIFCSNNYFAHTRSSNKRKEMLAKNGELPRSLALRGKENLW